MRVPGVPVLLVIALASLPLCAKAAMVTWVDYTNFSTRLDELANDATVDPFSSTEKAAIQDEIVRQLGVIYAAFEVSFVTTQPGSGSYHRLHFGATTTETGLLGLANEIDWRNLDANDPADIYTRNFAFILDEFDGSNQRSEQIRQLTTALAGSAAHELAHNLGLLHEDSYGDRRIGPANYSNTSGYQNEHIMATGSTGLGETGREQLRGFNTLETAKLEYAQGLTASPPSSVAEQGGPHGSYNTAQAVSLVDLSISKTRGRNVTGAISSSGELDYYSFQGGAGYRFTAQCMSWAIDRITDYIDPFIYLYDTDGTTLLASCDDTRWDGNSFNATATVRSYDSTILNWTLPRQGTYYISVTAPYGNPYNTGNYELFLNLDLPEPGTTALVVIGLVGLALLRRRRTP